MSISFLWPSEVKADRIALPDGCVAYHLTHRSIGELGRIVLRPLRAGGCGLDCEVAGAGGAVAIAERQAVLEPLARSFAAKLGGQ